MAELTGDIGVARVADVGIARTSAAPTWLARFRAMPLARRYVAVLLVAVLVKQVFLVVVSPPFSGHDEVAHFGYIRTVAEERRVPVIPDLDEWRAAYLAQRDFPGDYHPLDLYPYQRYALDWCCEPTANGGRFATNPAPAMSLPRPGEDPALFPNGWQYAANHPPLYYVAMTPVYWATSSLSIESQQYALRAAAIPFSLAIVWLSYLIVRSIFPRDAFLAMTVPTFVGFQTQLSYEGAMVNNDIVSFLVFTLILYQLTRVVRFGVTMPRALGLGLVLGLGLLTKGTLITAAPLIALVMIHRVGWRSARRWSVLGAATAGIAALVAAPWYAFLLRTYGNLDGLDQVRVLQRLNNRTFEGEDAPTLLDLLWNWGFAKERWQETWAAFGWRLIPIDGWLLAVIGVVCAVLAVRGLAYLVELYARRGGSARSPAELASTRHQRFALLLMVLTVLVAYGAVLQFGTQFRLTQARYYFHALVPLAIIMMVGLRQLLPVSWRPYGAGGVLVAMVALNVVIYSQYVLPYWYLAS